MSDRQERRTSWRVDLWWVLYQRCPRRLRRLERWLHDRLMVAICPYCDGDGRVHDGEGGWWDCPDCTPYQPTGEAS